MLQPKGNDKSGVYLEFAFPALRTLCALHTLHALHWMEKTQTLLDCTALKYTVQKQILV